MTLDDALKQRDEYLQSVGGCSDGNCVIVRPKGMHTNGGCKCYRDQIKMQQVCYAFNTFAEQISEIANTQGAVMKFNIDKDWLRKKIEADGEEGEIGAGMPMETQEDCDRITEHLKRVTQKEPNDSA